MAGCQTQPPQPYEVEPKGEGTIRDHAFGLGPLADPLSVGDEGARDPYGRTPTRYSNVGSKNLNIGADQDKIRRIVAATDGFDPGIVTIVGNDAWVFARISPEYTDEEKEEKIEELHRRLQFAMQRYDIHLNIDEAK